jgi:hypothetical protein
VTSGAIIDRSRTLDSLFQKTPIITPQKKRTVQPGDAFEDIVFKQGFEIVKL